MEAAAAAGGDGGVGPASTGPRRRGGVEGGPVGGAGGAADAVAASAITPQATLLDGIIASITTPGASPALISTINAAILLLLAVVVWYSVTAGALDLHLTVMAALALGLLLSLNWFISMVRSAEDKRD